MWVLKQFFISIRETETNSMLEKKKKIIFIIVPPLRKILNGSIWSEQRNLVGNHPTPQPCILLSNIWISSLLWNSCWKICSLLTVVFPEYVGTLAVIVGELRERGHVTINVEAKCFSVSLERNKPHSCIEQGGEEELTSTLILTYTVHSDVIRILRLMMTSKVSCFIS